MTAAATAPSLVELEAPAHVPAKFRPGPGGWTARGLVLLLIGALVVAYPLSVPPFRARALALAVIYAIIGLSVNILIGYTGQISLGHQAFVGFGAFASAYAVSRSGQSFVVAVMVGVGVGALQALVLGAVALRIRGLYFALITLSYGLMASDSLFRIKSLTGGGAGQRAPKPAPFQTELRYYYLCLAFLAVVVFVDWRMTASKAGRALHALRENPRHAASLGIDVSAYTLFAFVMSGAIAGLAGVLFADLNGVVTSSLFDFPHALLFVIMTVVGGLRSRAGVVIGSAFFALADTIIKSKITVPRTHVVLGLEGPLRRFDFTLPILAVAIAVPLCAAAWKRRRRLWASAWAATALVSALILVPNRIFTFPYLEGRLRQIPPLSPELAPLVLGPVLLLLTLTSFPGGIGQQIRPLVRWLGGGRFHSHAHGTEAPSAGA
jgi:branched-chain amino acid transport system permease protein